MTPLRIVIAEDHFLLREGMQKLLEASGRVQVLAGVDTAEALLEAASHHQPDAVITDIRLPPGYGMEGIEAAHALRSGKEAPGVVVLSQYANALYAFELFKHGADGRAYLLKEHVGDVDQLLDALVAVARGGSVIDPLVVEDLFRQRDRRVAGALDPLTAREHEVLEVMAQGKSNAAIAHALAISESGVEKHINAILLKLGIDGTDPDVNRRVAAVLAYLGARGAGEGG